MSFFDSIEIDELLYPIIVHQRRLVPDSEGPGRHRGAQASLVEFGPRHADLDVLYQSDGSVHRPQGVRGGGSGGGARNVIQRKNGQTEPADGWATVHLAPGDTIVAVSCGGGGYGPPYSRDPMLVAADVSAGYLSPARAKSIYGVAVDGTGRLDIAETKRLRAS